MDFESIVPTEAGRRVVEAYDRAEAAEEKLAIIARLMEEEAQHGELTAREREALRIAKGET